MIVELFDSVAGAAIHVNPAYVVTLRPSPTDPLNETIVTLEGGERIRVRGDHEDVAERLAANAESRP
jgi:hypothetical protein